MKIVLVIHGYPMRYNAGSEVYTQGLAHALAERHEVHVFTRQQNKFLPDYTLSEEIDSADPRVTLHTINLTQTLDQYRHIGVDRLFGKLLDQLRADIVHIGHLNHLSTSLVFEAHKRDIPIIFTLHDYWLMCPQDSSFRFAPKIQLNSSLYAMDKITGSVRNGAMRVTFQALPKKKKWTLLIGPIGCRDVWHIYAR